MKTKKTKKTKKKTNVKDSILKWIDKNHYYEVEVEYDRSPCNGKMCNDICRCTTLSNVFVKCANPQELALSAMPKDHINTIVHYCFERILVNQQIWDQYSWDVEVDNGYYGEEIGKVMIDYNTAASIKENVEKMMSLKTDIEKILFVLELEYGYVLSCLSGATDAKIKVVKLDDIRIGNTEYYRKIKTNKCLVSKHNYTAIAVCVPEEDKYRIIDGYHRYSLAKKQSFKNVDIVLIEGIHENK